MRRLRRAGGTPRLPSLASLEKKEGARVIEVAAADPLNLQGVLTPDARIPAQAKGKVRVA
jgi:hypothetical protein